MSKERIVLSSIAVIGLLVGLGAATYIVSNPSKEATPTSASNKFLTDLSDISNDAVTELIYVDEAGFSFRYPDTIDIVDTTPASGEYYTVLKLQKGKEKMNVVIQDTTLESVDDWRATDEMQRDLVGAISLDGISARQYESSSTFLTLAIDQGVLYLIESPLTDYWDDAHELFVSSFDFDDQEPAADVVTEGTTGTAIEGNVIYEEEETIE